MYLLSVQDHRLESQPVHIYASRLVQECLESLADRDQAIAKEFLLELLELLPAYLHFLEISSSLILEYLSQMLSSFG